jgi:hypothetical protein
MEHALRHHLLGGVSAEAQHVTFHSQDFDRVGRNGAYLVAGLKYGSKSAWQIPAGA